MDQVEEVKTKINIVNLIGEYVSLKKSGRNYKGLCPFHGEKTPSFMVNEELQIFKCFGCAKGGDVIKFLMEVEGLEFGEALTKLAERVGVKLPEFEKGPMDKKRKLYEINNMAAEYYHYLLVEHELGKVARDYLSGRGITEKLIETFKLGFALPDWDGLTVYLRDKKHVNRELLWGSGLVVGNERVVDKFRGRIMFPLFDGGGKVAGFSGRILPEFERGEEAKYMNTAETEIYHKSKMLFGLTLARQEIVRKKRVVIVEGEMDMISSYAAGVTETVAIKGTALTEEMIEILARLAETFLFALDSDDAGEAAMKRSIDSSEKRGLNIKMVQISGGKDPDEIARKRAGDWKKMVEAAVPAYEFFFNKAIDRYGVSSVEGITKVLKEVVPLLAKIDNSVIQEVWEKKLAEKIGVDKQRVKDEVDRIRGKSFEAVVVDKNRENNSSGMEAEALAAMMQMDADEKKKMLKVIGEMEVVGTAMKLAKKLLLESKKEGLNVWIKSLPEELKGMAEEAYMKIGEGEDEERQRVKMVVNWVRRLINEEKGRLISRLSLAENQGNEAEVDSIGVRLVKLDAVRSRLEAA